MHGAVHPSKESRAFAPRDIVFSRQIERLLAEIPHSAWVVVRYGIDRELVDIVHSQRGDHEFLERMARSEHASLVLERSPGQILRTRSPLGPFADGRTLLVGTMGHFSGMMIILRDPIVGAFAGVDRRPLEQALVDLSTCLATPAAAGIFAGILDQVRRRAQPAIFFVTSAAAIEYYYLPPQDEWFRTLLIPDALRFPEPLEIAIQTQIALLSETIGMPSTRIAFVPPATILHVNPLAGRQRDRYSVTVERLQTRKTIELAADRYALSRREREVLALLLEGHGTTQVAEILNIASSTANDHVKRMLLKTNSRNRAELVARALGWDRYLHDR
jgi:DNA-binding CsgD family transcriptional regulator